MHTQPIGASMAQLLTLMAVALVRANLGQQQIGEEAA